MHQNLKFGLHDYSLFLSESYKRPVTIFTHEVKTLAYNFDIRCEWYKNIYNLQF